MYMEGLGNNTMTGNYITVFEGKFEQRVTQETPGAISRVNKIGNTVWVKHYTDFTGKLVDVKVRDGGAVYGKQWMFIFVAGGKNYNIQLPYSNSLSSSLLKMLPNIDPTKLVTLQPSRKEEDGIMKSSIFVKQDGELVKYAHTKTNPNGMPEKELVTVNGLTVSDYTKQLAFFEEMIETKIRPKLEGSKEEVVAQDFGPVEKSEGLDNLANAMKSVDQPEEEDF
jgi:hypothetical protein